MSERCDAELKIDGVVFTKCRLTPGHGGPHETHPTKIYWDGEQRVDPDVLVSGERIHRR